jgi:ABC-type multidrug transport system permease subunit
MFISFSDLIIISLIILGGFWTKEIILRFPNDLREYKSSRDRTDKFIILFYWVSTSLIILFTVLYIASKVYLILNPPV